ncbi:MAG: ferritin family protein [Desulfobacterales bacterium]|jgi:rubrerythrin|nr:ferritin family protein [Desulfobacterales bacterium]
MIYDFNADAVFEMAEHIEKNGAKFYRNAARRVTTPGIREMLLRLAAMEDEHQKTFAEFRKKLSASERQPLMAGIDPDIQKYLKALADTRVFHHKKKPNVAISETHTEIDIIEDIYRSAIRAEKDSIVFYAGIREMVPEAFGKSKIDDIIKEEMGHITTLSVELAGVNK